MRMPTRAPIPWGRLLAVLREHYKRGEWRVPVLRDRGAEPFDVLVSTILSHRARDETTLRAFRQLKQTYPDAPSLANADPARLRSLIRPVGLPESKAKGLITMARAIVERHGGTVPSSMEDLLGLPMVGPKTASAVKVFGFEHPEIPVDTHIHRVVNRLGAVHTSSPEQTRVRLAEVVPRRFWGQLNPVLVQHGQNVCLARRPRCPLCPVSRWCSFPPRTSSFHGGERT